MTDTLSLDIKTSISWLFEEALDLSTLSDSSKLEYTQSMADGTDSAQADKIWHDTRTVATGVNDDLDLTALTLSVHGSTVTISMAKIRAILIVNTATGTGETLHLDSSVANSFVGIYHGSATSQMEIPPDSPMLLVNKADGWTVTGGTGDILRISNSGAGSITYKIVVVGTSV